MDISVVLCTYNRGELLANALQSLREQTVNGISYEILVVDNNSTDHTRELVQRFIDEDPHFRYVFEKQQGLSCARNAGIAAAHADILVFTDDDIKFAADWLQQNYQAGVRFPDAAYLGGQVLPVWEGEVPSWIPHSVNPLAIQTPGPHCLKYSWDDPQCLVGANLAVRRSTFARVGLFDIRTQRVKGGIGSTEDHDWEKKVWDAGGHGMYVPDIVCYTKVPAERLEKSYHRRWHVGNGKFQAIACNSEYEGTRRVFGVTPYVYKRAIQTLGEFLIARLTGRHNTFWVETRVWFFLGYIRQKWKDHFRLRQQASEHAF